MYKFKIQWAIHNKKDAKKLIDVLGARSLDKICFRDNDDKIIDEYNGFIMYGFGLAESKTKQYIEKMYKKNDVAYIEFIRK